MMQPNYEALTLEYTLKKQAFIHKTKFLNPRLKFGINLLKKIHPSMAQASKT